MTYRRRIGTPGEEAVLIHLSQFEPASHLDHAEKHGLKATSAFERMRRVWDKKAIYIHHWERNWQGGPLLPFYAIGSLPDAPKIAPIPKAESNRKAMAKVSKEVKKRNARRSGEQRKERMKVDPAYRAKINNYRSAWARKKFGHAMSERKKEEFLNLIAMQFGNTWRFSTRRKAA